MNEKSLKKNINRRRMIKMSSGALLAVSSNWFLPKITLGSDDEIRLGSLCELSGMVATVGVEMSHGIQLAVGMLNQSGGVGGRKITLFTEDTESKKDVGLSKARRLVDRKKVHFLTGIVFSSISMAVQPYAREKKIILVNSGSGNDVLVAPPMCNRYFFKAQMSAKAGAMAAQTPAKMTGPRWFFTADNYSYGRMTVDYAERAARLVQPKLQKVGEEYTNLGETNFAPMLTKVLITQPDCLVLQQFGAGYSRIIKQARQMGITSHIHHGFFSYADALAAGDAVVGMTAGAVFIRDNPYIPKAKIFSDAFKNKFGYYPGWAAACGYDGVMMIMEAAKKAGTIDTEAVIETMESMVYKNLIRGNSGHFRKSDHLFVSNAWSVKVNKHPKYKYSQEIIDNYSEKECSHFLTPENKTGCS